MAPGRAYRDAITRYQDAWEAFGAAWESAPGKMYQQRGPSIETPKIAACTWLLKLLDATKVSATVFSRQAFETGHHAYDSVADFHKIPRT